jgi:hypothetical protein
VVHLPDDLGGTSVQRLSRQRPVQEMWISYVHRFDARGVGGGGALVAAGNRDCEVIERTLLDIRKRLRGPVVKYLLV